MVSLAGLENLLADPAQRLVEAAPRRCLAIGRERILHHAQCVEHSFEHGVVPGRLGAEMAGGLLECQQAAEEVARIHGGNVCRRQHREMMRVIPVQQVAAEPGHLLDGAQRVAGAYQQLLRVDVTQVVGGDVGDEQQTDVGGRTPVRHHAFGALLEVIRGQPVVLGAHESLEEQPRAACDTAQMRAVVGTQLLDGDGARTPGDHTDLWREQPQCEHGRRIPQRRRPHEGDAAAHRQRRRGPHPQPAPEPPGPSARPVPRWLHRRRRPLQQAPAADPAPVHRSGDGVENQPRFLDQERHGEQPARGVAGKVVCQAYRAAAPQGTPQQPDDAGERRHEQGHEREHRPVQR